METLPLKTSDFTTPATVKDIIKELLRKDENGRYICPEEKSKELCNALNRMRGLAGTEDAEYEIVEPKRITLH